MSLPRAALLCGLLALFGCRGGNEGLDVDFSDVESEVLASSSTVRHAPPLRIALSAIVSPARNLGSHEELLWHVGKQMGRPVELVLRKTYAEANLLLERSRIDAAFVCSGPYIDAKARFGAEILAVPRVEGKTTYMSFIIVGADSPVRDFEDLKGRRFAFTDPLSTTGKLYPDYLLARRGTTPDEFFSEIIYTRGHDNSVRAVAEGLVDGAAVDHLIWRQMRAEEPDLVDKTRVIKRSPPFGIPPVIVNPSLDEDVKRGLRRSLLTLHETGPGRELLRRAGIERFVPQSDAAYDSIREMLAEIARRDSH